MSAAGSSSSSWSRSPCAACKFLRRKCTAECVFAPYFPPDQPQKFAAVHKVFGASNVTKLLSELPPQRREDAVSSLAYEAEARIKDPVYGCVGAISLLQRQLLHLQQELALAHTDLARLMSAPTISDSSFPSSSPSSFASAIPIDSFSGGAGGSDNLHTLLLQQQLQQQQQQQQQINYAHMQQLVNHLLLQQHHHSAPHPSAAAAAAHRRHVARDAVQQLVDQLRPASRGDWASAAARERIVEQLTRAGGGSLEAGIAALANISFNIIPSGGDDFSGGGSSSSANSGGCNLP